MNSATMALTRRDALYAGTSFCLAASFPVGSIAAGNPVDLLVAEAMRAPRAMRDGGRPYSDPAGQKGRLPDNSYDYAVETAKRSRTVAGHARHLRAAHLSTPDRETLEALIWDLDRDVGLAPFYYHEFPLGYSSSQLASLTLQFFPPPGPDAAGYLARARQAPAYVENIRRRLLGQLELGLTAPRAEGIRALEQFRTESGEVSKALLAAADSAEKGNAGDQAFGRELTQIVGGPLATAFAELGETLEHRYVPALSEQSRMARAEDAPGYFRELALARISDEFDLAGIHDTAREALAVIDADLARMRRGLGGSADAAAFNASMAGSRRWFARDADDVKSRLESAIGLVTPLVPQFFRSMPTTPYRVAPLPDFLNGRLLNGYFSPPTAADPRGTYFYNTSRLDVANWAWTKPLVSHELMPGHHLQAALLFEAKGLSDYRRNLFVPGFVEGWGEYSRQLMEEAGLYRDDPWGLYASRLMERRFVLRTVVETGINQPSWTWQKAQADLASDPFTRPETTLQLALSAATFRSTGMLYWWGLQRFLKLREKARARAGTTFDIRDFHNRVMRGDNLPFAQVEHRALAAIS